MGGIFSLKKKLPEKKRQLPKQRNVVACLKPNLPLFYPVDTEGLWRSHLVVNPGRGKWSFLFLCSGCYLLEMSGTSQMPFKRWAVLQAAVYPSKNHGSYPPSPEFLSCQLSVHFICCKVQVFSCLVLFQDLNINFPLWKAPALEEV